MIEQYKQIPTLLECEKLVSDYEWFSRSEQTVGGHKVVSFKYNLSTDELYQAPGGLNMRGITFVDGQIAALPFPKFYNVQEKDIDICKFDIETDLKNAYVKADGSLISFLLVGEDMKIKTMKSIQSDVTIQAEKDLLDFPLVQLLAAELLSKKFTPMFEYVSPENRIVLQYAKPDFVFLGARNMETGEMLFPHEFKPDHLLGITCAEHFTSKEQVETHLGKEGVEGVVITTHSGLMIKMKTAEYCGLHRVISNFSDKLVLESIYDKTERRINDRLDDMISVMAEMDLVEMVDRATFIRETYLYRIEAWKNLCEGMIEKQKHLSRKELASMLFASKDRSIGVACMAILDNKPAVIERLIFDQMITEFKKGN
jgi:RNA ligase